MNFAMVLAFMFPGIQIGEQGSECSIEMGPSGIPEIEKWNRAEPQPTQAEIEAAYPAALAAAQRASIKPVTRKQMLIALHRVGLLDPIRGAVAASGDVELQIAFDEALTFERNDAFLEAMRVGMGKTDAEVDTIFALAASV